MKYLKTLVLAVLLFGVTTPMSAAVPTMKQVDEFMQQQPQTTDPRVEKAQKAFELAVTNLMQGLMSEELTDNEKKIKAIFEAEDLAASIEETDKTLENISDDDPKAEEKVLEAYKKNKYIKQLIPLLEAEQTRIKDYDQPTFEKLVITFVITTIASQEALKEMMEEGGAATDCNHAGAPANATFCPDCGARIK